MAKKETKSSCVKATQKIKIVMIFIGKLNYRRIYLECEVTGWKGRKFFSAV
jgi:hypothetical protein